MLTFGSLFSGIGGIDLGFERAGMTCAWQVEIDDYCNKVLAKHWPNVARYRDAREVGKHNLQSVDVIVGGFPCQPHSVAGKQRGAADDRNLWPEYLRIVTELRPTWVVGENVPGITNTEFESVLLGVEDKTILRKQDSDYYRRIYTLQKNLFLDKVCHDLKSIGYEITVLEIPAVAFDANHLRYRIFVVAYSASSRSRGKSRDALHERRATRESWREGLQETTGRKDGVAIGDNQPTSQDVAHAESGRIDRISGNNSGTRCEKLRTQEVGRQSNGGGEDVAHAQGPGARNERQNGGSRSGKVDAPDDTSCTCRGNDRPGNGQAMAHSERKSSAGWTHGIERGQRSQEESARHGRQRGGVKDDRWPVEPNVGRVAHGVPNRVDRLRGLGNAVVPQVAEFLAGLIVAASEVDEVLIF